jgi:hypothetical protein
MHGSRFALCHEVDTNQQFHLLNMASLSISVADYPRGGSRRFIPLADIGDPQKTYCSIDLPIPSKNRKQPIMMSLPSWIGVEIGHAPESRTSS